MPSSEAGSSGGLGGLYSRMEDAYYSFLDSVENAGIPIYNVIDPFEERGIHTLPLAAALLLLLLLAAFFLLFPQAPSQTQFVLSVTSSDQPIANAVVQVFDGDALIATGQSSQDGTLQFDSLPAHPLRFQVSAKGYEQQEQTFDLSFSSRAAVSLQCSSASCTTGTPTPLPTATPRPTAVPTPSVPPLPPATPTPAFHSPVTFNVIVHDNSTGQPLQGATVELRRSLSSALLENLTTDSNGAASFGPIEYGTKAYLVVYADNYTTFNGIVAGQQLTLDADGQSYSIILYPKVASSVATLFKVTDEGGNPLTAYVEFYVNDATTPDYHATIPGSGTVLLPVGTRIRAVVYPPTGTDFSQQSISFNAGDAVATAVLYHSVSPQNAPLSCDVSVPASVQGNVFSLSPGSRLAIYAQFSYPPAGQVYFQCGDSQSYASCVGAVCASQCIFDSPGTKLVRAFSGNASCALAQPISVQFNSAPQYSVAVSRPVLALGATTDVLVSYANDFSGASSNLLVSCGDGTNAVPQSCGDSSGQCAVRCGPYSTAGSKEVSVVAGSAKVASTTLLVGQSPSCSISLTPSFPVETQPVSVAVQLRYSSAANSVSVSCGGQTVDAACSPATGTCTAQCSFPHPGSYAVVAGAKDEPSCSGTATALQLQSSGLTSCADAAATPVGRCSVSEPLYCNSNGLLENRASQCGCPAGWRVSPDNPDLCQKTGSVGIVGFANGSLSLGKLANGLVAGLGQVLAYANGTAVVSPVSAGGVPLGAEQLVSFSGGTFSTGGVTSQGQVTGVLNAIAYGPGGSVAVVAVTNGLLPQGVSSVLTTGQGGLSLSAVSSGALTQPSTVGQVVGVTGGTVSLVSLDGGPSRCSDGTPVGQCSSEKPFLCNLLGFSVPSASLCGCPTGWQQSPNSPDQCSPMPNNSSSLPAACADGKTLPGQCKVGGGPWLCGPDGSSYSSAASKCGCPAVGGVQWVADGESCIAPPPQACPDGTTQPGSCKADSVPVACRADGEGYEQKASLCGCPAGYSQSGDSCSPVSASPSCSVDVSPKFVSPGQAAQVAVSVQGMAQVPAASAVHVLCDGQSSTATMSFDPNLNEFVGTCVYSNPPAGQSLARPYSASIGGANGINCIPSQPGSVRIQPSAPTQCSATGTAVGSCVSGSAPYQCVVQGDSFNGYSTTFIEKASACGCPSGYGAVGDSCIAGSLPTSCQDGTPIGQCSASAVVGRPMRCVQPDPSGSPYLTQFVPDSNTCGCPAGYLQDGNGCVLPSGGAIAVAVQGSVFKTTQTIGGNAVLSGFNFPLATQLGNLQLQCSSSDGSAPGRVSFDPTQCTALAGTGPSGVYCPFTCTYNAGASGIKRVQATFAAGSSPVTAFSPDFIVSGYPGGSCTLSTDNAFLRLGGRSVLTINFTTPYDVNGERQLLTGALGNSYNFSCGTVVSPQGIVTQLGPISQLDCNGASGSCTATCEYNSTSIDVNQTPQTVPFFEGLPGTPLSFACLGPAVRITDVPVLARVKVSYLGVPVPNAQVTLFSVVGGNASQVCNSAPTNATGTADFGFCQSLFSQASYSLLQGSNVYAVAQLGASDGAGNTLALQGTSQTVSLQVPEKAGVNPISVSIDFPPGKVSESATDALSGSVTQNLTLASFDVYCPSVLLSSSPSLSTVLRRVGSCTGASCIAASDALLAGCVVNASAPGYAPQSYGQPVIASADSSSPQNKVSVAASLVPTSFSENSYFQIVGVTDSEGAFGVPGASLPLSGLTLKKGFRYIVTASLRTFNATDQVGVFFQPSTDKESYIYSNTFPPGLSYLPSASSGQLYTDNGLCSLAAVDYSSPPTPKLYDWLDLRALNRQGAGVSLASSSPLQLQFDIVPNDLVEGNQSAMAVRSLTFSSAATPSFTLSPYDPGALNSSKYSTIPFCMAAARTTPYALLDSSRICQNNYCLQNQFSQPAISSDARGDGFVAQSALNCEPTNNSGHCVDVYSDFKVTNNDLSSLPPTFESSYFLTFSVDPVHYYIKQLQIFNGTGATTLVNLGDYGAVTNRTNSTMQVNLEPLLTAPYGSIQPALSGRLVLTPLYPTNGSKAYATISYSSPRKSVSLSQWTYVVARTGVPTIYGQLNGVPLLRQLEQADSLDAGFGYGQYAAGALDPSTQFNSSSWDCVGYEKGWPCRYVEATYSAQLFEEFSDGRITYNDPSGNFSLSGLYYNISTSGGKVRFQSPLLSGNGSVLSLPIGRVSIGETISVLMLLKPPFGPSNPVPITLGVENATLDATALNATGLVSAKRTYGTVRLSAIDALTSQPVASTVFSVQYAGRILDPCTFSSNNSCVFRLKPISWVSACPYSSEVSSVAGCANVTSLPPGYLPSPVLAFSPFAADGSAPGTVIAGTRVEMPVYLLSPPSTPSSLQLVSVVRKDTGYPACASAVSGIPACSDQNFSLTKGVTYTANFLGSMGQSQLGGIYFSVGASTEEGQLISAPASLSSGSSAIPVTGFAGSPVAGTCVNYTSSPAGMLSNGVNWMATEVNNSGRGGYSFAAKYDFQIASFVSGQFVNLSFSSFIANSSNFGPMLYFRTPYDPDLAYNYSINGKDWCQANAISVAARVIDASTACNSLSCITVNLQQAGTQSPSPPHGFPVAAKSSWLMWSNAPYPKVALDFSVNVLQQTNAKRLHFKADPALFNATSVTFTSFCGLGTQGRPVSWAADGFSIDLSDCRTIGSQPDIAGEVLFDAGVSPSSLPSNASYTLSYIGDQQSTDFASWVQLTGIDTVNTTGYANIYASVMQRQVNSSGGVSVSSQVVCSPYAGSCAKTAFFSTLSNDCTELGIDNAFAQSGQPMCHASWMEFTYHITSRPAVANANVTFAITSGDARIPSIPDGVVQTQAAYVVRTASGQTIVTNFTPDSSGKSVTAQLPNILLSEQFDFVVRVDPRAAGQFTTVMSFNNGVQNNLTISANVQGQPPLPIACPGPACPDVLPCGRADLFFSAQVDPGTASTKLVPSCSNATLLVDPIMPADALPIRFDQSFLNACSQGKDPFSLGLYRIDTVPDAQRPPGSRALQPSDVAVDTTNDLLEFNGFGFGANRDKRLVQGNNLVWPGENQSIASGAEIGRARLTVSCQAAGVKSASVDIVLKSNTLTTQGDDGSSVSLLNAVDSSGIYFQDATHQLMWALYNGQFPAGVLVSPTNEPSNHSSSIPFNRFSRVQYYLTNVANSQLRQAGSYPVYVSPVYSGTQLQLNSSGSLSSNTLAAGGVVVTDPAHRQGNIMSALVGDAHNDPNVNVLFQQFLNSSNSNTNSSVCSAISYVSEVYRTLPREFKAYSQKVAYSTAFRRTKGPSDLSFCAYPVASKPFYCNSDGTITPQASVCGCPSGFEKTPDGTNCQPISQLPNPATVCADGTRPGQCSAIAPYYCDPSTLVLSPNANCGTAPSGSSSFCADGTPAGGCLRQNSRGLVCYGDSQSWMVPNIEVQTETETCNSCAPVASPYIPLYTPSQSLSISFSTPLSAAVSNFPPGSTPSSAVALTLDPSIDPHATITSTLSDSRAAGAAAVHVEYQQGGNPSCPVGSGQWCTDGNLFASQSQPGLSKTSSNTFSSVFPVAPPTSGGVFPAAGTWVVRTVAAFPDANNDQLTDYSPPLQIVVQQATKACLADPAATSYTCNGVDNAAWCNSKCVNGEVSVPVRAGPGILSGQPILWSNATPIQTYQLPANATDLDNYSGYPYKAFFNAQSDPFTLSFPLMTWGSQQVPDWNLTQIFSGYQTTNSQCNEGTGFYELQAISSNGSKDWRFTSTLKTLPLSNYFLNTEPSDAGNFNPSVPYGYIQGGTFGCQMHAEVAPANQWVPGFSSVVSQQHEKALCNLQMVSVLAHTHDCNGKCDCVQVNSVPFGGNCGCALPGCNGTIGQCSGGAPLVCPDPTRCIQTTTQGTSGTTQQACACTDSVDVSCLGPQFLPQLQGQFGTTQGYICDQVSPASNALSCPWQGCSLQGDNTCKCQNQVDPACTPITGLFGILVFGYTCPAQPANPTGQCNPSYCNLASSGMHSRGDNGCSSGSIIISN